MSNSQRDLGEHYRLMASEEQPVEKSGGSDGDETTDDGGDDIGDDETTHDGGDERADGDETTGCCRGWLRDYQRGQEATKAAAP